MKNTALLLAGLAALAAAPPALALASCSSDGAAQPVALFERFISADCQACWADPAAVAPAGDAPAVVLDWIVPGAAGEDAPLAAAATSDALARLQTLGRAVPARTDVHIASVQPLPGAALRVAHGPPFNDYVGTALAFALAQGARQRGAAAQPWAFHLLLVESVPAGTEGTAVARNLVRKMLYGTWEGRLQLSQKEHSRWSEMRAMRIPEGAQPERLRLVGWVQDAQGRTVAAVQSACR